MIIMQFFSTSMTAGSKAVVKNKSLLRKVNIPREMFPVSSVLVSMYNQVPMYVVMIGADFLFGWNPDWVAFGAAVLAFALIGVYGLGLAILLSAITVFVRDMSNVVDVANTLLRWFAPVIYTYSMIKPKIAPYPLLQTIYINNPFNAAVMLNNRAFWIPAWPPDPAHPNINPVTLASLQELPANMFQRSLIMLVAGIIFIFVAQMIFRRVEGGFADKL